MPVRLSSERAGEDDVSAEVLDVVELQVSSGRWPARTRGTVVEVFHDGVMVEISDDEGRGLDFLELPRDAVTVVEPHERDPHLAV
jgi:hypothetical protein